MHDVRGGASRLLLSNILDDTGRSFLHEGRPSALTRLVCGPKTWNPNKEPHARHQKTRNPHFLEDFPRFSLVSGFLSAGSGFSLRAQNMEPKQGTLSKAPENKELTFWATRHTQGLWVPNVLVLALDYWRHLCYANGAWYPDCQGSQE